MDARRESEPTLMKNRTTVERKSERELVITNLQRPGAHRVRGVDQARAAQAVVAPKSTASPFLRGDVRVGVYRLEFGYELQSLWRSSVGISK
jgi:hypothetical protein